MTSENLLVDKVSHLRGSQLALQVSPPKGTDLQFVYRAAMSVYWDPGTRSLEDRFDCETSLVASFKRMARALESEYGLLLVPSPSLVWQGISITDQAALQDSWH